MTWFPLANVRLTKDDIRHAPDYQAEARDEGDVRKAHEEYYGAQPARGRR